MDVWPRGQCHDKEEAHCARRVCCPVCACPSCLQRRIHLTCKGKKRQRPQHGKLLSTLHKGEPGMQAWRIEELLVLFQMTRCMARGLLPLPWPTATINTPAKSGEDKLGEDTQYYYVTAKLSLSPLGRPWILLLSRGKRRWEATSTRGIISENHDAKWGAEAETQPEPEPEPSCLFCCQGVSHSSVSWFRFSLCPYSKARDGHPSDQLLTHSLTIPTVVSQHVRPPDAGRKRDRNVNLSLDRSPGSAAALA